MKVITKEAAIAALSFAPDEVKPLQGFYLPGVMAAIGKRYALARGPSVQEAIEKGARFQNGRCALEDGEIAIAELAFYNDAVSVTTTDTSDSEKVLHDVMGWLKTTFKFRDPITAPVAAFQSDLVVEFDHDLRFAFKIFEPLSKFIEAQRNTLGIAAKPVVFSRFGLGADHALPGPHADFWVERRVGYPWIKGRYFTKAHLPTDAHIKALELFEEITAFKNFKKKS